MFKEIFIAVSGTTPQILTESLYYYYSEYYNKNRHFEKIVIITTKIGKKKLIDIILKNKILDKLEENLALKKGSIPFTADDIIVVQGNDGRFLNDIRNTEDNDLIAKLIFSQVKKWTEDPETRVTASVAGGRKTMTSYLAAAFQLYGREQDEVIHILAPTEKEQQDPNINAGIWFYPENPAHPDEKLDVAEIPILKIGRYYLDIKQLNLPVEDLVETLQRKVANLADYAEILKINGKIFTLGDKKIELSPLSAAFQRYFI